MKKSYSNIIFGICVVLLGISMLGRYTGFIDFTLFFDGWWTLFLIIPGFMGLFSRGSRFFSCIILTVGIVLLLNAQGVIQDNLIWKIMLSSFIIILGINIIFSNIVIRKQFNRIEDNDDNMEIESYIAIFGGKEERYSKGVFKGANLTAIFGGVELDLRDAKVDKDVKINATAVFGGCDIIAPQNVNVKVCGANVFGGTDNKVGVINDDYPTIYINAEAIFGGVEIK